jgi:pSer/pThr/pTyr-binding forkhead associated (FHA) protein
MGFRLRRQAISRRTEEGGLYTENGTPDPILQTVPGLDATLNKSFYSQQPARDSEGGPQTVAPRLVSIKEKNPPSVEKEIILSEDEIIIGSDANQANLVLNFPDISPAHTTLLKSSRGSVTIADLGSETGTWVNYAPVSSAGVILHNGDLVQIGKFSFRYHIGRLG